MGHRRRELSTRSVPGRCSGSCEDVDGLARVRLRDLDVRRLRLEPSRLRGPRALGLLRELPEERIDVGYVV